MIVGEIYEEKVEWQGVVRIRYKCEAHDKVAYMTENRAKVAADKVSRNSGEPFKAKLDRCGHWHIKGPRRKFR